MTMTVVIKEQMRVLVGETLADIYRQLRSLTGMEEESMKKPFYQKEINKNQNSLRSF